MFCASASFFLPAAFRGRQTQYVRQTRRNKSERTQAQTHRDEVGINKKVSLCLAEQNKTKQKLKEKLRTTYKNLAKAKLMNVRNIENITRNMKLVRWNLRHGNLEGEMQDETRGMTNRRKHK